MEILDHVGQLRLNSCIDGVGIDVGDVLVDDGLEQMILEQFDIMLVNHSMARTNLNKSEELVTNTTTASKYIPMRPRISIN